MREFFLRHSFKRLRRAFSPMCVCFNLCINNRSSRINIPRKANFMMSSDYIDPRITRRLIRVEWYCSFALSSCLFVRDFRVKTLCNVSPLLVKELDGIPVRGQATPTVYAAHNHVRRFARRRRRVCRAVETNVILCIFVYAAMFICSVNNWNVDWENVLLYESITKRLYCLYFMTYDYNFYG